MFLRRRCNILIEGKVRKGRSVEAVSFLAEKGTKRTSVRRNDVQLINEACHPKNKNINNDTVTLNVTDKHKNDNQ